MKQKFRMPFIYLLLAVGLTISIGSCSKDKEVQPIENHKKDADPKIIKFLSITLGVTPDEIKFDKEKQTFIIRTNVYELKEIEALYDRANEYKATHEK